jgi:hypothetical protein
MDDVDFRVGLLLDAMAADPLMPPLPRFSAVLRALCRFAGFGMGSWSTFLSAASLVIYGI